MVPVTIAQHYGVLRSKLGLGMLVCTGPDVQPNGCQLPLRITLYKKLFEQTLMEYNVVSSMVHVETLDLKQEATEWLR